MWQRFSWVFDDIPHVEVRTYEPQAAHPKKEIQMDVSENRGTPKSSIFMGFSIINHPFWGIPIFGNTQMKTLNPIYFPNPPAISGLGADPTLTRASCKRLEISQRFKGDKFWWIGVPQNGWFIMENPIKMDDLGIPLFLETPDFLQFGDEHLLGLLCCFSV